MKNPRINIYECEYGCQNVTVDVDHGVTPAMIQCRFKGTKERPVNPKYIGDDGFCVGTARSCFYPKGPKPSHIKDPTWEWYKPTKEWAQEEDKKHPGSFEHWEKGGLFFRERTDKEPVYQ